MNIALLTSNHLRHKYIASRIAKKLSLKVIVSEQKSNSIEDTVSYDDEDKQLLNKHFKDREMSEMFYFGGNTFPLVDELVEIEHGKINSEEIISLLKKHEIDCILLFGTSIIKPMILNLFHNKVINLHLGLSPYYKGSGTNFFPIVNKDFECIGATVHLATAEVDAGAILKQFRPEIEEGDTIHSIGNKVIRKAGEIYPEIVEQYLNGKIILQPQNECDKEKVYRIKDFTPNVLRQAIEVIDGGSISDYLKSKEMRLKLKPIVTNDE